MGKLVKLLSTGAGLAAEVVNSRMDNRLPSQRQQSQPTRPSASTYMISNSQQYVATRGINSPSPSVSPATYDMHKEQEDCEFDDLGAPPPDYYQAINRTRLAPTSQPQMGSPSSGRLPHPVIIPQRRPEDKSRGWMLAYAPVLNDFGIDQATFLKFLIDFNDSHKSSAYLDAVNLAAFGVGFAPGIGPMVVSMAVPVAVQYAKKTQTERQSHTYLGRMNQELFEPCGLYAVVMTLQPTDQASLMVDPATSNVIGGQSNQYNNIQYDNSQYMPPNLPESAPLVFPTPDDVASIRPRGNRLQEMGHLTADYFDRRAQAKFAQHNPSSALAIRDVRFNSPLGDARGSNQGGNDGLLGQVTGGGLSRLRQKSPKSLQKHTQRVERELQKQSKGGLIKNLKSKAAINTDVLYLMIVERPSDNEIENLSVNPDGTYQPVSELDGTAVHNTVGDDVSGNDDAGYSAAYPDRPPLPPRQRPNADSYPLDAAPGDYNYANSGWAYNDGMNPYSR